MELLIGEGKERFDKLKVAGEFDILAQKIDVVHNQDIKNRIFVFRKRKDDEISEFLEIPESVPYDPKYEWLVFQNPSFISLDKNVVPANAKDCIELFIGVNNGGGLKFTAYNPKDLDMKNLMKTLNSINGLGSICICNFIYIWVHGKIRTLKIEYKSLTPKNISI
jgi:hypothetical protein